MRLQPTFCPLTLNSDGTEEQQITDLNLWSDLPDIFQGSIVFRQRSSDKEHGNISLTKLGNETFIRHILQDGVVCYPRWRPDGKLIAYEFYHDKEQDIWIVDSAGGNIGPLIKNARHPFWTRDGKKVVFTRNYEIYMYNTQTQTEKQLTTVTKKGIAAKFPAISPDEISIAFVAYYEETKRGLYIINLKTDDTLIVENCLMPYWTNDPNYLLCTYSPKPGLPAQIIMLNVITGEKIPITNNRRENDAPSWMSIAK